MNYLETIILVAYVATSDPVDSNYTNRLELFTFAFNDYWFNFFFRPKSYQY